MSSDKFNLSSYENIINNYSAASNFSNKTKKALNSIADQKLKEKLYYFLQATQDTEIDIDIARKINSLNLKNKDEITGLLNAYDNLIKLGSELIIINSNLNKLKNSQWVNLETVPHSLISFNPITRDEIPTRIIDHYYIEFKQLLQPSANIEDFDLFNKDLQKTNIRIKNITKEIPLKQLSDLDQEVLNTKAVFDKMNYLSSYKNTQNPFSISDISRLKGPDLAFANKLMQPTYKTFLESYKPSIEAAKSYVKSYIDLITGHREASKEPSNQDSKIQRNSKFTDKEVQRKFTKRSKNI